MKSSLAPLSERLNVIYFKNIYFESINKEISRVALKYKMQYRKLHFRKLYITLKTMKVHACAICYKKASECIDDENILNWLRIDCYNKQYHVYYCGLDDDSYHLCASKKKWFFPICIEANNFSFITSMVVAKFKLIFDSSNFSDVIGLA